MKRSIMNRTGQSVLEYATLITVVVLVVIFGSLYFKRGLQGRWKESSDQIGEQFTTGEKYTVETRQQSAREEVTGTSGEITSGNWSRSAVLDTLPQVGTSPVVTIAGVGGKESGYTGHETTREDYVQQSVGTGKLGPHGTFDSGQFSKKGLFKDD